MIRVAALLLPLLVSGCNLAPDISALAQDTNPVCVTFTSVWATVVINRLHGCDK